MADNVAITAGSGTSIATDDAGAGGHIQIIKLAISTDGSATLIPAEATNGLAVDVTRVIPGTSATHLGKAEDAGHSSGDTGVMPLGVRNDANADLSNTDLDYTPFSVDAKGNQNIITRRGLVRVSVQSAGLTTGATAYTVGDQLGNELTFAGCARASGGGGYITGASVISIADNIGAIDLVIFKKTITPAADNAAMSFTDANVVADFVAIIQLAGAYDIGANRVCQAFNLAIPYTCDVTSLFGHMCTRFAIAGSSFAAATDIQVILYVEPN